MHIEPNDLLLFARVAETGSFTRAAEQAGIPKSTLSRRITALENQLGERLLQRTTRQLVLTELGLRLLDHARQIAEETELATSLAQHRQAEPSGILRISMPHDFANRVMAPILADFLERYPAVSLELDLTARRVDLLAESFDLAIRFGDLPDDATLASKPVYVSQQALYASPAYLDRCGIPERPEDLLRHELLQLLTRSRTVAKWVLRRGEEVWEAGTPGRAAANSPELLVELARRHRGIVRAPMEYAREYLDAGELVRVLPDWQSSSITCWAVFPGRRLMPAKTRVFIDFLQASLGG